MTSLPASDSRKRTRNIAVVVGVIALIALIAGGAYILVSRNLATQRPAGVLKDNLRANTNLRVALRMADESDSQDVLGNAMAAHFRESSPGRGAAKTGPGRITVFQSAYPGEAD